MSHKIFLLVLSIILISFIFVNEAFCSSSSTTYEGLVSAGSSGAFSAASSIYDGQGSVGQLVIGLSGTGGAGGTAGLDMGLGFLWALEPGLISSPQEYEIYDLKAFSDATKEEIPVSTWQRRNDPYFTWKMRLKYPVITILGYSVAIDEEPDELIDTTEEYYDGFASPPLSDGKHIFYVKAATTGGVWGQAQPFEFWVDTQPPKATNLLPATGQVITDNTFPLSLDLSDVSSGVNNSTINLYIDNGPLNFTLENGHVTATPQPPYSNGNVTAHIQAEDLAGNVLNMAWGFIVDADLPVGSILINGGEESTIYARVRLNLEAEDDTTEVTQMILSNDGIFDTEGWENFQELRTDWILSEPQRAGTKSVYCMFKDEAGNISSVYSDDVILLNASIDTIITNGPYSPTKELGAQFKFQSTFEDALFSYKLDTENWSAWFPSTEASFSNLSIGNHIFSVKSGKDLNGDETITEEEEDPIPAQWTWIIQTTEAPVTKERTLYWRTE
ncbi:MAG: hypothetical protein PHG69_02355 [Candidatus Omnitrophica bacterium]|nr:hypothetical protein [Candidatus Omnitrophota bacterium]